MGKWGLSTLRMRVMAPVVRKWFDVKLGMLLMRDKRVPWRYKLLALGAGGLLTALLISSELPIESLLATLLIGIPVDISVDGIETILGPILFGSAILPHIVPQSLWREREIVEMVS